MTPTKPLTDSQLQAARLVAMAKATIPDIAKAVGVSMRTVNNWKALPEFNAEVARIANEWRDKARTKGIADSDMRLRCMNDRHKRLCAVINARAKDPEMQEVPGGKTGLLVRTYKLITWREADDSGKMVSATKALNEYAVDTGMLAEMRALERAAAEEKGEYNPKEEKAPIGPMAAVQNHITINFVKTPDAP